MDIDALHSALLSLTLLSEQFHSARASVSAATGGAPSAFGELLNGMERDLRIAKATLARELGFPLCLCCWPPELLATDGKGHTYCPVSSKTLVALNVPAHEPWPSANVEGNGTESADWIPRAQKKKLHEARDTGGLVGAAG